MKLTVIRTWAIAQVVIGIVIVASTALYAPPIFDKMREESQRTGANLIEIADALAAVRLSYAETATNLFSTAGKFEDVEAKLKDAGGKIGDVGHTFEKRGQKFEKAERHNRESKILGKVKTPGAEFLADIYGDLKEWTLAASTNLCDVGRDLTAIATTVGKQREAILKYQDDGHPKTLLAMATSSQTIGHVGEMLSEAKAIDTLRRSVYILCGVITLLFIGNGIVLLVASAGTVSSTPRQTPQGA